MKQDFNNIVERVLEEFEISIPIGTYSTRVGLARILSPILARKETTILSYFCPDTPANSIFIDQERKFGKRDSMTRLAYTRNPWFQIVPTQILEEYEPKFVGRFEPRGVAQYARMHALAMLAIPQKNLESLLQLLNSVELGPQTHTLIVNAYQNHAPKPVTFDMSETDKKLNRLAHSLYEGMGVEDRMVFSNLLNHLLVPGSNLDQDNLMGKYENLASVNLEEVPTEWVCLS